MSWTAATRSLLWALLSGVLGGGVGAALCIASIGRSTSSTAALDFFFALPIVTLLWAVPSSGIGFCAAYLFEGRRMGRSLTSFRMLLAGCVLVGLAAASSAYVVKNLAIGWEVRRVPAMDEAELERVLASRYFGGDCFVLAQVAMNPRASPAILREIATRSDPELHEKLSSSFDILGSNRKGLAVMRLVARNPNVDAETLEILALSNNGYVLSDVAWNPKLSETTLRRLEAKEDPILESSVALNPKTPPSVLARLSQSSDWSLRSTVAANPSASPDTLDRLAHDAEFLVRLNVVSNRSAPPQVLESLRGDPDARVRAAFRRQP